MGPFTITPSMPHHTSRGVSPSDRGSYTVTRLKGVAMSSHVSATFSVKSWDESAFDAVTDVPKMTRAVVTKDYTGDIEGSSTTEWLMAYAADGSASFVGMERITGTVTGRKGTLVLQHVGSYSDGVAEARLVTVQGASSGELVTALGEGSFTADPGGSVALDISFD
jgi:hypothetical protein